MQIENFLHLKEFCNSLSPEQLQHAVRVGIVDSHYETVAEAYVTEEDEYFDHGDSLGTLQQIKETNPDDWEDVIADATLSPKGVPVLINDYKTALS